MIRDIYKLIEGLKSYSLEKFFSGFFRGAQFDEIYTQNCDDFLAWAAYTSSFSDLSPEEKEEVVSLRHEASKYVQTDFKEGLNTKVNSTRLHIEEVSYLHHPLCLLALLSAANFILMLMPVYLNGFKLNSR